MGKPIKTIELGGESRPVRFSFRTILDVETKTGKPISEVAASGMMNDVVVMMYAALITGANKAGKTINFTQEDVIDWLDDAEDLTALVQAFSEVLSESMPASKEGAEAAEGK